MRTLLCVLGTQLEQEWITADEDQALGKTVLNVVDVKVFRKYCFHVFHGNRFFSAKIIRKRPTSLDERWKLSLFLGELQVASLFLDEFYELAEDGVLAEQGFVACDEELAAGTGERHVQLAVDDVAVFNETGGCEEV